MGSLLRTAEGLGVDQVILSGYTPYPQMPDDTRLPHEAAKLHKQIHKTALGAEETQSWQHIQNVDRAITALQADGFTVYALEQMEHAKPLPSFKPPKHIAILVGREVEGVEQEVLEMCNGALEIPMFGQKESFNVAQAAAMALYHCKFQ